MKRNENIGGPAPGDVRATLRAPRRPVQGPPGAAPRGIVSRAPLPAPVRTPSADAPAASPVARIVPIREPASLVVGPDGIVSDCSKAALLLFGYPREALVGTPVSRFLPRLGEFKLLDGGLPDSRLAFLCRCEVAFTAIASDGRRFPGLLTVSRIGGPGEGGLRIIVREAADAKAR